MNKRSYSKLNQLQRLLPEGMVADAAWLERHGYSSALRSQYVSAGWLNCPVRRVYRRGYGPLAWEQVILSLQQLEEMPLTVGGRTALEMGSSAALSVGRRAATNFGIWATTPPLIYWSHFCRFFRVFLWP